MSLIKSQCLFHASNVIRRQQELRLFLPRDSHQTQSNPLLKPLVWFLCRNQSTSNSISVFKPTEQLVQSSLHLLYATATYTSYKGPHLSVAHHYLYPGIWAHNTDLSSSLINILSPNSFHFSPSPIILLNFETSMNAAFSLQDNLLLAKIHTYIWHQYLATDLQIV